MTERREFTCNLRETRMKKNVIGAAGKTEKRRDVLEDREEKKMNSEEMLTKNRRACRVKKMRRKDERG